VKPLTLGEIAGLTKGNLRGDPQQQITGAAPLIDARDGEITFFENQRYLPQLRASQASAAFVPADFAEDVRLNVIRVGQPFKAFEQMVRHFAPPPVQYAPGVHPTAVVDSSVQLGKRVSIQPHVVIEPGVSVGDDTVIGAGSYIGHETIIGAKCLIHPRVTIADRTKIGSRVVIHAGVVIGGDGFGFDKEGEKYVKQAQLGIVQIDDDVEIGANTAIDRARFGRTWIQQGVKLDNLVHIAHNVVIGENTVVAAQVGISGSTRVGKRVVLAGQVGVVGHVEVGDDATFMAKSGISKNVPGGGTWWGVPVVPLHEAKQQVVWVRQLGKWIERIKALEKKIGGLRGEDQGE
jgi:UDP-3-O-[3-hydroxymyristoyl] glucosamine N-acyltransferase